MESTRPCLLRMLLVAMVLSASWAMAQPEPDADASGVQRGSIVEDRAAAKLLAAGDARYDADEAPKAVEIWQSVIERYPRSKVRYAAHMRLGHHLLKRERAYDRARVHFEAAAEEQNTDDAQRAEATLHVGVCFYEARNFGKSFTIMRQVIEQFPVSEQVNEAYYYIGLGHFQLGHYSRAIEALQKVGTALTTKDRGEEKVEAGKRLFIRIEDADLAVLEPGEAVKIRCRTTQGDEETVDCVPVGRNVRVVLGSITTELGRPKPGNGRLEVRGDDHVDVTYVDRHTADRSFDQPRLRRIRVVGNAIAQVTDGAYQQSLQGVVLGKEMSVQVADADRDVSDEADALPLVVEVYRAKTQQEIESELADLAAKGLATKPANPPGDAPRDADEAERAKLLDATDDGPKVDPLKRIDRLSLSLREVKIERASVARPAAPTAEPTERAGDEPKLPAVADPAAAKPGEDFASAVERESVDHSIHSGVFRGSVLIVKAEQADESDGALQAMPGDVVRITYEDALHLGVEPRTVTSQAKAVEGNLGGVRVTRADISDEELRLNTKLRTATALTSIGNHYKQFGLHDNAIGKYDEALTVCEQIVDDARKLGGRVLEETYVQLWRIYFEMDKLELAAAMCQRLQSEFPQSGFVDEAMLQLAAVARKQGDLDRAVSLYNRLVGIRTSQLRGEAQFGIAECYEAMAAKVAGQGPGATAQADQLYERAFQEYKKVFDQYPDSGRVGEAVSKMANFYYQKKDYARAIDVFETVLANQPDARFLDVILFNYGRCLYRMDRKAEARRKFDQLISEFPESTLAAESKRISDALIKSGF